MADVDDAQVTRCARCDMRAPDGQKHCAACARALRADGEASGPAASRGPWGVRQYLAVALLGGLGVALIAAMAAGGKRRTTTMVPLTDPVQSAAAPAVPTEPPALPDPAASIRAAAQAQFSAVKPEQRAAAVRACVVGSTCPQAQLDGIVAAGAHEREQEELRRLSHAWGAHVAATRGTDGEQLSRVVLATAELHLEECGVADLKKLDWTTQGEADKDIAGARGKMINVYGPVAQIRKEGDVHWGTMSTSAGPIFFRVVGGTKGVVAGRYAEIAGLVVQRYHYENTMGGLTDSILIVGRVRGQADSDKPLPPAPPRGATLAAAPAGPRETTAPPSSTRGAPLAPPNHAASTLPAAPTAPPPERRSGVLDDRPPPSPRIPAQLEAATAPPGPATAATEN